MSLIRHDEEIRCMDCGGELDAVPLEGLDGESRFRFNVTHRKDGTPIANLPTAGAFLGTIELGHCRACGNEQAVLDSLGDDPEAWAKLPAWEIEN